MPNCLFDKYSYILKDPMSEFWMVFSLFFVSHTVLARSGLRRLLTKWLGERNYLILYSLLSLALLVWLVDTARDAPRQMLWAWRHEFYWFPNILMPLACILFVAGFIVPNPLSLAPRKKGFSPEKPDLIVAITRHPILWGFFFWSFSHILPNGEYPLAFLFFAFTAFSLLGLSLVDRKRKRQLGNPEWKKLSQNTSAIFLASPGLWQGRFTITSCTLAGIVLGLTLYAALYWLHEIFFSITPTPPF